MMRALLCLTLSVQLLLAAPALAQAPIIETTLDPAETIPGQPVTLRIKVLVPTWMPSPPVYPDLEQPNLLIRLPERATSPVSERIEGETWSGTNRAYRITPLAPGQFNLSGKTITLTYADPDSSDPVTIDAPLNPVTITATIPPAAQGLSPFIGASAFELDQTLDGVPEGELQVGDAITRTVTAKIDGTTPILIPALQPRPESGPFRAYPDEPKVSETENRGDLSGTRVETVSFVAQTGGPATLPDIEIQWFNLDSGKVETASLPGITVDIAAPPAPPPSPRTIALWLSGVVATILLTYLAWRVAAPRYTAWSSARHARWLASEAHAAKQVHSAIRSRDLGAIYTALDGWTGFHPHIETAGLFQDLTTKLAEIGRDRFGPVPSDPRGWNNVSACFSTLVKQVNRSSQRNPSQRALNFGQDKPVVDHFHGDQG